MVQNKVSEWNNTAAHLLLMHADGGWVVMVILKSLTVIRTYCWLDFDDSALILKIPTEHKH